jgi:plastocyanin
VSSLALPSRRGVITAGGACLAGLILPRLVRASAGLVEIGMRSDPDGATVWFDPIGVLIEPGTTIRWTIHQNVHSTAAYHPANGKHALRIPAEAAPWDSDYLVNPGDHFEVKLTVPGVYDYFCLPHEAAGMVGRIIVGEPAGPGTLPFDYFKDMPEAADWLPVPEAAQAAFPAVEEIMRSGIVRRAPPDGKSA